jgi:hypothetical protein
MPHGLLQQSPSLLERTCPEDRPDRRPNQLLQILRAGPEGIAQEMDCAALPGAAQHPGDRGLEALVGVRDHQLDASQAAADQAAQALAPERLGLGRPDI